MRDASVSALGIRALLLGAAAMGVDVQGIVGELGLGPQLLADADARVPYAKALMLWRRLSEQSGDPHFGLHLAERAGPGAYDVLDYAAQTSPNLGAALSQMIRYQRILDTGTTIASQDHGDFIHIEQRHSVPRSQRVRHAPEAFFAVLIVRARQLTAQRVCPHEMRFRHASPAATDEHQRVFGCPVCFSNPVTTMVLDARVLALPIPNADPKLAAIIERQAAQMMRDLPTSDGPLDRIRGAVATAVRNGDARLSAVATHVGMSPRTLQRRLRQADLSLKELVEGSRQDMAMTLLSGPRPLHDIAFLLGYSELSAFVRAFKRWTGSTPSAWRASR